jgi:catechol 2,3-dioxygenase-like lactoylglutathione lyase family enzyme
MINIYSHDLERLGAFYQRLGFSESFRTPKQGEPAHIELTLGQFTIGLATVDSAISVHGLQPDLDGRPIELVFRTDNTDRDYERLTADGAPSLSAPHDFLAGRLRSAWIADPDGNPIQLVQQR